MWALIGTFIAAHSTTCVIAAVTAIYGADKGIAASKATTHNSLPGAIWGGVKGAWTGLLGLAPQIGAEVAAAKPSLAPAIQAAEQVIAAQAAPQSSSGQIVGGQPSQAVGGRP